MPKGHLSPLQPPLPGDTARARRTRPHVSTRLRREGARAHGLAGCGSAARAQRNQAHMPCWRAFNEHNTPRGVHAATWKCRTNAPVAPERMGQLVCWYATCTQSALRTPGSRCRSRPGWCTPPTRCSRPYPVGLWAFGVRACVRSVWACGQCIALWQGSCTTACMTRTCAVFGCVTVPTTLPAEQAAHGTGRTRVPHVSEQLALPAGGALDARAHTRARAPCTWCSTARQCGVCA
jgi:hypothetical protein